MLHKQSSNVASQNHKLSLMSLSGIASNISPSLRGDHSPLRKYIGQIPQDYDDLNMTRQGESLMMEIVPDYDDRRHAAGPMSGMGADDTKTYNQRIGAARSRLISDKTARNIESLKQQIPSKNDDFASLEEELLGLSNQRGHKDNKRKASYNILQSGGSSPMRYVYGSILLLKQ